MHAVGGCFSGRPLHGDLLPTLQTPTQIIAGARDRVIPPSNATFLQARFPKSKLDIIGAGRFVWEERADAYASLVTSWSILGYAQA